MRKLNCNIGYQCGNGCINKLYKCPSEKSPQVSNSIGRYVMFAKRVAIPTAKGELKKKFKELKTLMGTLKVNTQLINEATDEIVNKTIGVIVKKLEEQKMSDNDVEVLYNKIIDNSPEETRKYLEENPIVKESIIRTLALTASIGTGIDPKWDEYSFEVIPNLTVQGHKVGGYHDKDNKKIQIDKIEGTTFVNGPDEVASAFAHEIAHGVEIKVGPDRLKEALDLHSIGYNFEGSMGKLTISEGEICRKYAKGGYKDEDGNIYATELIATLFELIENYYNNRQILAKTLLNAKGEPNKQLAFAWYILFNEKSPWEV